MKQRISIAHVAIALVIAAACVDFVGLYQRHAYLVGVSRAYKSELSKLIATRAPDRATQQRAEEFARSFDQCVASWHGTPVDTAAFSYCDQQEVQRLQTSEDIQAIAIFVQSRGEAAKSALGKVAEPFPERVASFFLPGRITALSIIDPRWRAAVESRQ